MMKRKKTKHQPVPASNGASRAQKEHLNVAILVRGYRTRYIQDYLNTAYG